MSDAPNTVLYDGDCPFCVFQMKVLTWMDWCNRARLRPISDPEAAELAPEVSREDLLEAMHCITAEGRVLRGARAIRHLSLRMPLLVPLGLFLWLPGVIWVAERMYRVVSRNRLVISRVFGCREACAMLPQREREGDQLRESPSPDGAVGESHGS
jgi:predicted DCC family thiol-disulfide oxidoreductase YuxK